MMADELDAMPPAPPWDPEVRSAVKELPASPAAERALLGSVLIDGGLLPSITDVVMPEDMAAEGHRLVLSSCLRVQAAGMKCDLLTVEEDLVANGQLERAGGSGYLASLLDVVPDIDNAHNYARLVKEAAVRRRAVLAARNVAAGVGTASALKDALRIALSDLEEIDAGRAKTKRPTLPFVSAEKLRSHLKIVAETSRPTGFPSLDAALGGGLPGATVFGLTGAPGSTKSAIALQIALDRAKHNGGFVYVYAPDQGGRQPLKRLASTFGDVAHDDQAYMRFREEVGAYLRVVDETEPGVSIETFTKMMLTVTDAAAVLIDTPQTVYSEEEEDQRAKIDRTMDAAKRIADTLTVPVFVPSHANRAATAARNRADRNSELSAALGSAAIEHRSQVCLFLEKLKVDPGKPTTIRAVVTKSLERTGDVFCVALDPALWRLREEAAPAEESQPPVTEVELTRQKELDAEVHAHMQKMWGESGSPSQLTFITSFRAQRQITQKTSVRDVAVVEALARLVALKKIHMVKGPRGAKIFERPTDAEAMSDVDG